MAFFRPLGRDIMKLKKLVILIFGIAMLTACGGFIDDERQVEHQEQEDNSPAQTLPPVVTTPAPPPPAPVTEPPPLPLPEIQVGNWERVTIYGDEDFVWATHLALALIRTRHHSMDAKVLYYIHTIRQACRDYTGGLWYFHGIPVYIVDRDTYRASVYFYAAALVHYAVHSRQGYDLHHALVAHFEEHGYDEAFDMAWDGFWLLFGTQAHPSSAPRNILAHELGFLRFEIEQEALEIEIGFLEDIGAPEQEILDARSFIGEIWWESCWGRCFCELDRSLWQIGQ